MKKSVVKPRKLAASLFLRSMSLSMMECTAIKFSGFAFDSRVRVMR